jgi:hypothetical protein
MRDYTFVAAPWRPLLRHLLRRFSENGLTVSRTFDLQAARRSLRDAAEAPCPHHGADRCTCQYLVLQVRRRGSGSTVLVLHGQDRVTKIATPSETSESRGGGVAAEVRRELAELLVERKER